MSFFLPCSLTSKSSDHDQQLVSDTGGLSSVKHSHDVSSCDCQPVSDTVFFSDGKTFHHISSHDKQQVSDNAPLFCQEVSSHDQQGVSNAAIFLPISLITLYPVTNSL
jgi:hypothetical protein